MIKFKKSNNNEAIEKMRSDLYLTLTAPIDAMWEQLYIASSQHYLIQDKDVNLGYCCVDENQCLVQIFLLQGYQNRLTDSITELIQSNLITSARISSNETISFNTCLTFHKYIKINTFCFQHKNTSIDVESSLKIELVTSEDIPLIKDFLNKQIGMDDNFGYTENLVSRKEIFMIKNSNVIIATSELRLSDSQPEIADLGIIVNKDFQGKGIGTQVMKMQVNKVLNLGRKPICSTTIDNVASRTIIERSGFYCSNIIFDIKLLNN